MPAIRKKNTYKIAFIFFIVNLFSAAVCLGQQEAATSVSRFKFKTVIIDAGHGGKDPGAHGAYSKEKNVALSIAKKLRDLIIDETTGIKVVMTRSTDVFVELHKRADIANNNHGNLFISIHCNSSPQRRSTERGTLLLVYGFHRSQEQREALRENASIYIEKDYKDKYNGYGNDAVVNTIVLNAFQQKYRKQSIQFGDLVNREFKKTDGRHSFGVKEQGVLVLAQSGMPAVLVETGFINNPSDEKYLNSDAGQTEIARSILRSLKQYRDNLEGR
ncbi:N-acetylmuramoyl-L-alanine amidase family protein [Mucilaginibacter pocheonensis]|uniref:N-acetylmuramoyl-L-alanine amidase n=1 Tax=Mucilaginibacter pocheonensis TaxID=398050 RepID=A0ABU1TGW7_9SPHI|nr:N-acetylmuramoyl-L-alanine amidase [Mucilaginibacter pocheonensis]MDR6944667.1 N-acetylmuramoyl-L-alanine amidase [Mucilaginibacter pocheonensis]